jgi:hypothetical protein
LKSIYGDKAFLGLRWSSIWRHHALLGLKTPRSRRALRAELASLISAPV